MSDPNSQINRVFEVLQKYSEGIQNRLKVKQIWISKIKKGEFIKNVIKSHPYVLSGKSKRTFIQFDDSPEQLNDIQKANRSLVKNTQAVFDTIRVKIPGTLNFDKEWDKDKGIEINLSDISITSNDIVKTLLSCFN